MDWIYNKAIIFGLGKIAFQCAEKIKNTFDINVVLYDMNDEPSRFLKVNANKSNIKYEFQDKQEIFLAIEKEESNILLLSVYNPVIIPARILDKLNIRAINLHHSLLPCHPGMYSEAWAIFEQDEYSGITWHLMTSKLDAGDIIIQKKIPISDQTTSYNLLNDMNEAAYKAFEEFIPDVMNGSTKSFKQEKISSIKFHYKKDKPNNGILDLSWDLSKISAFLRAYDYFVTSPFGKPMVKCDGEMYIWKKYKIMPCNLTSKSICIDEHNLNVKGNGLKILLIGIEKYITDSE